MTTEQVCSEFAEALREAGRVPAPGAGPEWQTDLDTMSVRLTLRTVPAPETATS